MEENLEPQPRLVSQSDFFRLFSRCVWFGSDCFAISRGLLLLAAAAPVPITLRADINMHGLCVAISTNAATAWHGAQIFRQGPLAHALDLNIGRRAIDMQ